MLGNRLTGQGNAILCSRSGAYLEQGLSRLFAQVVDDAATCAVRKSLENKIEEIISHRSLICSNFTAYQVRWQGRPRKRPNELSTAERSVPSQFEHCAANAGRTSGGGLSWSSTSSFQDDVLRRNDHGHQLACPLAGRIKQPVGGVVTLPVPWSAQKDQLDRLNQQALDPPP